MEHYIVLGSGIFVIWALFVMSVGSKSTVWILKNRETVIGLSIITTVLVGACFMFFVYLGNIKSLYDNLEIIIALNAIAFFILRSFLDTKKAPEEKNLSSENTKQYRVFDNIDLEERFKERQGKLITWNMGGDEAYEIVNVDVEAIRKRFSGLRDILTDEIGFPIGIEITKEMKMNLSKLVESSNNFGDVVGYELTTNKSAVKKVPMYINLLDVFNRIYNLYPKVLGEFEFEKRINKFGSVEMAFLDAANDLSMKKIPINIVQLYALVESECHTDVLGAIKNIIQERTTQKEGIYMYSLFLLTSAEVENKNLKDVLDEEASLANKPGAIREDANPQEVLSE